VLPYFVPVEAERTRIVDEARDACMHRTRGPASTTPLGQAVDTRLQEVSGLKDDSVSWTARRRRDGAWVVGVSYNARGRRKAEWLWQPTSRQVSPLDPAAARLGADALPAPAKRKVVKPAKPAAKKAPPAKAAVRKAPAKRAEAKPATAKKAAASKAAVARPAAAKKAAPKPTRATRPVATKPAAAPKRAVARKAPAPPKVTKPRRPRVVVAPPPEEEGPFFEPAVIQLPVAVPVAAPAVVEEPPAAPEQDDQTQQEPEAAPAAAARRPGQRVPVPSWSDVLLGVTGPRDESRRSG